MLDFHLLFYSQSFAVPKSFCNPSLPLSPPQGTQRGLIQLYDLGTLLLPSIRDRTNDAAEQKTEQHLKEQSHLTPPVPVPFPRCRAFGFFATVTKGEKAGNETESKKGEEQRWQEHRTCATFKCSNPAETSPVSPSTCSPFLKASLHVNIYYYTGGG